MRKLNKIIISFMLIVMMAITMFVPVFANNEISVYLDNEKIQFDVAPLLVNGRTMVPMRAIFEKLGATVEWENDLKLACAQKGDVLVGITIDDTTMYKNGEPIVLDVPAQLIGGRTLVPLRAVSEAFECDVQWNGNAQTVNIYTNKNHEQIQEAVKILRKWIDANYNNSQSGSDYVYYKGYEQVIGDHKYIFTVTDNRISCFYLAPRGSFTISIYLSDAQYSGRYSVDKERNVVEGKIIKSSFSNQLDLTYDSVECDYVGDKSIILKKFNEIVEDTLILFDNFLKEKNIGLTLKDFGLDYNLPEKSIHQVVAFDSLKTLVLNRQNDKINGKPVFVYEDNNYNQYSIQYNETFDTIRLTIRKIYRDSYTYSSINLTPDKQSYQCSFSFYHPKNKTNTPDFDSTYIIDAKTFGEKTNINFENIKGNKSNANSYKEVAKLMNLEMLDYTDYVLNKLKCSITDFGFNLK